MPTSSYDLVVVGGGPGGYVAAIRAAQLGMKVACVEKDKLGGICLHWGCIPTKALLRSAEVLELCRRASEFGVRIDGTVGVDYPAVLARARRVVDAQEKGIQFLLGKNKVAHVAGTARLAGPGSIVVAQRDGEVALSARHILLATGARAKALPGVDIDGSRVIDYRGALALPSLPASLLIIGAGAIGVEFATFFGALGVDVTLVEYLDRLVPVEDEEVSAALARAFAKRKLRVRTGHRVIGLAKAEQRVVVRIEPRAGGAVEELAAEVVLVAAGITGNVEGLGLESAGVRTDRGFITVDDVTYQSTAKHVYAVGDVAGQPALAHVASAEAVACVERIAGLAPPPIDYDTIPACTFSSPEIASVGLSEARAREQGIPVKIGRFPFRALGKARAIGETEGFAKVIYAEADGRLIGAHLVGPGASDLIAEVTLARATEVNAGSLIHTIHAHPTLAEAIREATEDAYGRAIHL